MINGLLKVTPWAGEPERARTGATAPRSGDGRIRIQPSVCPTAGASADRDAQRVCKVRWATVGKPRAVRPRQVSAEGFTQLTLRTFQNGASRHGQSGRDTERGPRIDILGMDSVTASYALQSDRAATCERITDKQRPRDAVRCRRLALPQLPPTCVAPTNGT